MPIVNKRENGTEIMNQGGMRAQDTQSSTSFVNSQKVNNLYFELNGNLLFIDPPKGPHVKINHKPGVRNYNHSCCNDIFFQLKFSVE